MAGRDAETALLLVLAAGLYLYYRYSMSAAGGAIVFGSGDVQAPATATAIPTTTATNTFTAAAPSTGVANLIENAFNQVFPMQLSAQGEANTKAQEGLSLVSYPDAGGYSIGYGHFITPSDTQKYGLVPGPNERIDQAFADQLFSDDKLKVENTINQNVTVVLSQNQFDALFDFVYNVGSGNFLKSTLLQYLNQGDYLDAANEFKKWTLSQGRINTNLVQRRTAEANLFMTA